MNRAALLRTLATLCVAAFTLTIATPQIHARQGADDPVGHDAGAATGLEPADQQVAARTAGVYRDEFELDEASCLLRSRTVVLDSSKIDTLLAIPL